MSESPEESDSEVESLHKEVERLRSERDAANKELGVFQSNFEETLRLKLEVYTQELEKRVTEKNSRDFRKWMAGIIAILAAAGFSAWETVQHSIERATEEKVGIAVRERVKASSDKLEEETKSEQESLRRLREQTMDATADFKVEAKEALTQIENMRQQVEQKRDVVVKSMELVNGQITQMVQARVTTSFSDSNPELDSAELVFGKLSERMVAISTADSVRRPMRIHASAAGHFQHAFCVRCRKPPNTKKRSEVFFVRSWSGFRNTAILHLLSYGMLAMMSGS